MANEEKPKQKVGFTIIKNDHVEFVVRFRNVHETVADNHFHA